VWNAREEAPAEEYKFFVDSLMGTIRCAAPDSLTLLRGESADWFPSLFLISLWTEMKSPAVKKRRMKVCH
jgi:hypothetical protein